MTIGERIRKARKEAGLTQKEVADKLGTIYQTYSQWERGVRTPRIASLVKIASVLDVPIESLICCTEERPEIMSEQKTINFGDGPIGYPPFDNEKRLRAIADENEKLLRAIADEIGKETKEAGLPWYAGLFNPKIFEAAKIAEEEKNNRTECNCMAEESAPSSQTAEKETLGARLRITRRKRNMTQLELSDKVGVTRSCLAKYEMNYIQPDLKMVEKLAKVLNVSPAWLCGWSDREE